ncbi:MAG: TetR/AcrR family transcriptional regulator C-terminal domain-containing protein, partial [Gaiellaceae bacterium]
FNAKIPHSHDSVAKLALLPEEEFPNLLEALPYFNECKDADWAFEFALDLIVGGIEHQLEKVPSQLDAG